MAPSRISVCVVGAGPVGLCSARQLAADPATFTFDVFERGREVGGTWVFTEKNGVDEHGLPAHSSMYENLRTNFLQEVMCFPDFPFPEAVGSSYPSHDVVLKYLQDYATHFDLRKYIQFETIVRAVKPLPKDGGCSWSVTAYNVKTKTEITKIYDAIMVCSGTNSTPDTPSIMGIETFNGHIMHCHDYKNSKRYKDLSVAVLGASFSGKDLSLEIGRVAKEVYICHDLSLLPYEMPSNIHQVKSIKEAAANGFTLDDGSFIKVDAVLYCTGYKYDFPFLNTDCGIAVIGKRVKHLYKHLVNIENPTMAVVGLPFLTVPLPVAFFQVAYFLKTLKKPSILPSKKEMYEKEEEDFQKKLALGNSPRHAHKMAGDLQWDYIDDLADIAGIPRIAPVFKELCEVCMNRMTVAFTTYRNDRYTEIFNKKMELKENQVVYNFGNSDK